MQVAVAQNEASLKSRPCPAIQAVILGPLAEWMPCSGSHKVPIWANAELHKQDGMRSKQTWLMASLY